MKKSSKRKRVLLIIGLSVLAVILSGGGFASRYYYTFYRPNLLPSELPVYIYVPRNADFGALVDSLRARGCLRNVESFIRAAKKEQLSQRMKGGRYELKFGMNNKTMVRLFALGWQSPVKLVISGNIRSVEKLAMVLSRPIEADSAAMLQTLTDEAFIAKMGFDSTSLFSLILPNTYEVYWNTLPDKIVERLYKEYQNYWNQERHDKASSIGLSLLQVSTLASIVQEETNYTPEMPAIAGVYMNRLKMGMPLQADPTLKFALRNAAIRRVLNVDKQVDSPYNTYKYRGLPPGPICVPSLATLEAVLNYERHNYLFFCANSNFNGSHLFAANLRDHMRNAKAWQQALNQRGIKR